MTTTRTKADIESELAAARQRLASNIEGLITQVHPQAVKTRALNDAADFTAGELNAARSLVVDGMGHYRWDKIAALATAVVGSVALVVVLRKIFR